MAVVTVYQNGVKAGCAPAPSDHERAKRGRCQGWTAKATRSNLEFLRSVKIDELTGLGHTFTLTVGRCPSSAKVWEAMRMAYVKRLKRAGMVRMHWVTEWQARGVPHLHGVAYFPRVYSDREYARQHGVVKDAWVAVVGEYQAERFSQDSKPLENELGWLKYLAKHAARGVTHYQRSADNVPLTWRGVTGRVWGKVGKWPRRDGMRLEMAQRGFWQFRRLVRRYRCADARAAGDRRRIVQARTMLRGSNPAECQVRGISEWMPQDVQLQMIHYVAAQGHAVLG